MDRDKIINEVNLHLPSSIRLFAVKCATRSFNAKKCVHARRYEYVFPLSCLTSVPHLQAKSDAELVAEVDALLQLFKGTKNFHNYTRKLKPSDSQSKRFMIDLGTSLETVGGLKLVRVRLFGQSFLYHQIRKMVGAILQVLVTGKSRDFILNSFCSNKMSVWLAPACGLLLDGVSG